MIPGPSKYDVEHLGSILAGEGDWWSALFFRLYAKSDAEHRWALRLAAPEHAAAFDRWERGGLR